MLCLPFFDGLKITQSKRSINTEFDAGFKSVKKVAKYFLQKSYNTKVIEKLSFTFITVCKVICFFLLITFVCDMFAFLSMDYKSPLNCCVGNI